MARGQQGRRFPVQPFAAVSAFVGQVMLLKIIHGGAFQQVTGAIAGLGV